MKGKKVSFTTGELNATGVINLKDMFILHNSSPLVGDSIPQHMFPSAMYVVNGTGQAVAINLIASGEITSYTNPDDPNFAPLVIPNGITWLPSAWMPIPKSVRVWARVVSGSASAALDITFLSFV